jgi:hypothetical protein
MDILLFIPDKDSSRIAILLDDESIVILPCSKFYYEQLKKGMFGPVEAVFLSGRQDVEIIEVIESAHELVNAVGNDYCDFESAINIIKVRYDNEGAVDNQINYTYTLAQS